MRAIKWAKQVETKGYTRYLDWYYCNKKDFEDVWDNTHYILLNYKGFMLRLGGKFVL